MKGHLSRSGFGEYRTATRRAFSGGQKDLASAYRRLLRAGFRTGEIVRVLKRFAANPELLDYLEPPEESVRFAFSRAGFGEGEFFYDASAD